MADNNTIGNWLYQELESIYIFEQKGWAAERVKRVGDRLQQGRMDENWKEVLVPWLQECTAFTVPGKYIFFSRALLEMCQDDEMAAFVISHELAHHELGHLDLFPDWLTQFSGRQATPLLRVLYLNFQQRLYGPERECAADKRGVDLCIRAGYAPGRCLAVFDILEKYALDMGDLSMVFGPDESDDELSPDASLHTKLRIWLFQRARGYLPIRDRRQALLQYLDSRSSRNTSI